MPDDQLRDVLQGLRTRLQDELDAQLQSLAQSHEQAVQEARRVGAAEAEQQWSSRLDALNQEWTARLDTEMANARAEAEKRLVAEGMRVRLEATQAAAESASQARREFEEALDGERQRTQQQLDAERERAERAVAEAHAALEEERRRAIEAIEEERRRAADAVEEEQRRAAAAIDEASRQPAPGATANGARLLDAIRRLDEATSLSEVLTTTTIAAAAEAARVSLFLVNTDHLEPWSVEGAVSMSAGWVRVNGPEAGILGEAIRSQQVVVTTAEGGEAPAFAALPRGRNACAVPFVLGGQPVAALYADEGTDGAVVPSWQDAIQILGRHAAACLAHLTALRTTQAMRLLSGGNGSQVSAGEDEQGARRYARLLVSEIKLYNESAVRLGRQKRDLSQRLRPEIDRARRLYDERVPASVHSRDAYFQQELVQTLADGDPALLG